MSAQALSYVDPKAPEPSANEGRNLLVATDSIIRPKIGGFTPSVMKGVVDGGVYLAPLAAYTAKRMFTRKGGGKKANPQDRINAKEILERYGKPSGININKLIGLRRKNNGGLAEEEFLRNYKQRKAGKVAKPKATKKVTWKNEADAAIAILSRFRKPTLSDVKSLATLMSKGEDTRGFLSVYQTKPLRSVKARAVVESPESPESPEPVVEAPVVRAPLTKKGLSVKQAQLQQNRTQARELLSQFGKPTAANVSQFVSLRRKGTNNSNLLRTFEERLRTRKANQNTKTANKARTVLKTIGRTQKAKTSATPKSATPKPATQKPMTRSRTAKVKNATVVSVHVYDGSQKAKFQGGELNAVKREIEKFINECQESQIHEYRLTMDNGYEGVIRSDDNMEFPPVFIKKFVGKRFIIHPIVGTEYLRPKMGVEIRFA